MLDKDERRYEAVPLPDRAGRDDAAMIASAERFRGEMATRRSVRDFAATSVPRAVIEACVLTAGSAPSGANQQPWHFEAVADPDLKAAIREAAEAEERQFYDGGAPDEWIRALEPIGTGWQKPHLTMAPWLIVIFAQRWGIREDGSRYKHYYVPESVGIASGFLIAALHQAGLSVLTHTPNPMRFLNDLLGRPEREKPVMILVVGHAAAGATVPKAAGLKKPLGEILGVRE